MKKTMTLLAAFLVASVCSAQSLDEIANKYYAANGIEILEKSQTIMMKGIVSQMGMELPITIMVKQPNKVKVIQEFNGMEIITLFDGEKGYMVNPLTGATEPIELPAEQLGSVQEYNVFKDSFMEAYKAGKMELEGEEEVEGKPAYKIAITNESGNTSITYLDKESFLPVKTEQTVSQMGMEMLVEAYVKERKEINGVKFGTRVAQFINGSEMGDITFETIEFDTPIEDSVFQL
ncbi:MAG: outer membrane lipoprotein-sorting protein [Bacteroidales bacterium]|nr:outer membrane lipoprotein-sorting protein [Bacteroidales bacterium]